MSAVISECGRYRYSLTREIAHLGNEGTVLFVMLNPSTADARKDDPTIRRCIGFAARWGYARLTVANMFALRAADPVALARADDPVGPDNDAWLGRLAAGAQEIIVAWGAHRFAEHREHHTLALIEERHGGSVNCLGQTKSLAPRHPLYLRGNKRPEPFERFAVAMCPSPPEPDAPSASTPEPG